jgi:DNA-binding protein H-NS
LNSIPLHIIKEEEMPKTYIEVQQQIEALQKEAEALKTAEKQGVIDRMKEAIVVYGITPEDLGFGGSRGRSARAGKRRGAAPKAKAATRVAPYGDAHGNSWGGRGPRPRWLKEALAGGSKLEDFARR